MATGRERETARREGGRDTVVICSTVIIHPASPGGAAHTTSFFGSVLARWWNLSSHATGQLTVTNTEKTI